MLRWQIRPYRVAIRAALGNALAQQRASQLCLVPDTLASPSYYVDERFVHLQPLHKGPAVDVLTTSNYSHHGLSTGMFASTALASIEHVLAAFIYSYLQGYQHLANRAFPLPQRLSQFLDRPLFPWKRLILGFSVGQFVFESLLTFRQYRFLQLPKPPAVLAKEVSKETFDKSQAYGRAKAQFSVVSGLWGQLANFAFIQFDVMPKLWSWTGDLLLKYAPAPFTGEISHSIVFVFTFMLIQQALSLPTRVYSTFVLEEKFGFNKQTPGLFISDMVKTNLLTAVLMPPILAGFLKIIQKTGSQFVFYTWVFTAGLQLLMTTLYPTFIQPLFNKLSPLEDGELKTKVNELAARFKFPLHDLYVIDGSKRSAHSNAFFYGLPWKKHIVIYDTLLEKSEPQEVLAILAHELGHWKLGHTTSLFGISQVRVPLLPP